MYSVNPDYIKTLFENRAGHIMLAGAGLLALVGFYWMKKTIEIEV
jgi:Flp pilus assembly protein TadB